MKIPKPLNEGEERLAFHLRTEGIRFEREYQFAPPRNWKSDFFIPNKLLVEIEGGLFQNGRHNRASGYIADLEKYNRAAILGFTLLRYTPQQVKAGLAIVEICAFIGKA
jgi:hypothetical protein